MDFQRYSRRGAWATSAGGIVLLMSLLICVYTFTSAGQLHIIDEKSIFAVTESLAQRGEVNTNVLAWTQWVNSPGEVLGAFGPDGQVYSKKGPAPAFLAVPWYMALGLLARLGVAVGFVQGMTLWNGILTALTAGLLWFTARRLGYSERTGAALGLLFGLCTIAWPYANHFFGEPVSALSLLASFYGLLSWRRTARTGWLWLAGSGAAVAVGTVTAHVLLIAIFGLYWLAILWEQRHTSSRLRSGGRFVVGAAVPFAIPLLLALLFLLLYNNARFGNLFETGYHFEAGEGFTTPLFDGLWGLLVSPYRGLFWHTPLFFGSLVAFIPFVGRHRLEGGIIIAVSLALIGLYAKWWMWWGGFAWGPRFLVPLSPFWVLALAPVLAGWQERKGSNVSLYRLLIVSLAALSFVVQLLAVSVNYVTYEYFVRADFPTDWANPLAFGPPAQRLIDWRYSPVLGQLYLAQENFVANTDLAWLWADGTIRWPLLIVSLTAIALLGWALRRWWLNQGNTQYATWLLAALPPLVMVVWLIGVRGHPHFGAEGMGYRAVLTDVCTRWNRDPIHAALVTVTPFTYQIPMNWLPDVCRRGLPIYGYATSSLEHPEAEQVLTGVLGQYQRVWLITAGLPPNAPENTVERWLVDHAYKAGDQWYDDYRLLSYGTSHALAEIPETPQTTLLTDDGGNQIEIVATRAPLAAVAGTILALEVAYQVRQPPVHDLRWFVQLIAPSGAAVAQFDSAPQQGYRAFSQLPVGDTLIERVGLELPHDLEAGSYQVIAGLYHPQAEGAPRLRTLAGGDFVEVATVQVQRP